MSQIRLEWEVEAERFERSDSEGPDEKRRRRRAALLLFALLCLLALAIALGAFLLRQRLLDIDRQFAQLLQDTVKAEVAALRIGDINSFLSIQSAADPDWLNRQRAAFQQYAQMKADGTIELTGSLLGVTIQGERARVLVQENIRDLPYQRLWFYRRADEGWRHVERDLSFWGAASAIESDAVAVHYRAVDEAFARSLSAALDSWLETGCETLDCGALPRLRVDIDPAAAAEAAWLDERAMRLRIRSPYVDIARADLPFDGWRRLLVGELLAERLVNAHTDYLQPAYPADAVFLRDSAIAWLNETFTQLDSGAALARSLAQAFGAESIGRLLRELTPGGGIALLNEVIDEPLESADLDWRDFVEWRLSLEAALMAAGKQNDWLALYDTADEAARLAAYERYDENAPRLDYRAIEAVAGQTAEGAAQLRASVHTEGDPAATEIILFNLVDGAWKRAS